MRKNCLGPWPRSVWDESERRWALGISLMDGDLAAECNVELMRLQGSVLSRSGRHVKPSLLVGNMAPRPANHTHPPSMLCGACGIAALRHVPVPYNK